MDNLLYSGVWVSEGHFITFVINDNDTATITETYIANGKDVETNQIAHIDKAIEYQQRYIKLGYDKIS